jgi:transposase
MVRRKRRTFSEAEKASAVEYVESSGKSIYRAAQDLDLTETALRRWVEQARVDRGEGPAGALTSEQIAELRHLRCEVRQLREEREILKKAAAFFAKEIS